MKPTIIIQLAPELKLAKEKRKPWKYIYREGNGFGFGGWAAKGGITQAKSFAKQLKSKMKTNPEIIVEEGENIVEEGVTKC